MATLTAIQTGVGRGSLGTMLHFSGPEVASIRCYTFDFDNSYPTGGEDISDIFDDFNTVLQIIPSTVSNRVVTVDYSGKKLLLYTALGTQASGSSDQSSISGVRLTVIGYPK